MVSRRENPSPHHAPANRLRIYRSRNRRRENRREVLGLQKTGEAGSRGKECVIGERSCHHCLIRRNIPCHYFPNASNTAKPSAAAAPAMRRVCSRSISENSASKP